jgi:putative exosortase-associated protein (TIGR04073 family)
MRFGKMILYSVVLTMVVGTSYCAADDDVPPVLYPVEKLSRGIANVAFGPLELLIRPYDISKDQGNIAALTYGVLSGVCWTVAREVVGVIDIVTFPMPLPGCTDNPLDEGWGYGPLMRPAWVVGPDHNAFNFFYFNDSLMTDN